MRRSTILHWRIWDSKREIHTHTRPVCCRNTSVKTNTWVDLVNSPDWLALHLTYLCEQRLGWRWKRALYFWWFVSFVKDAGSFAHGSTCFFLFLFLSTFVLKQGLIQYILPQAKYSMAWKLHIFPSYPSASVCRVVFCCFIFQYVLWWVWLVILLKWRIICELLLCISCTLPVFSRTQKMN